MTDSFDQTRYDVKARGIPPAELEPRSTISPAKSLKGIDWKSSFGGRFEPLALLGRGGFAIVYRVYDHKLRREVALKILHSSLASDEESLKWLKREGLATASLNHPHIVTLHDYEATDDCCYLVTELIVGKTLAQLIQEHPDGCDPRTAAEIVLYLAEALSHAHSKRVLHCDIKPSNVLLDSTLPTGSLPFSPRLADFGLASAPTLDSLSHSASGLMGTVYYLPPEIVDGQPQGFTAQGDIYALSTVLRELLTGRRAVTATTYSQIITQISKADFESWHSLHSSIPRDLIAICSQGMQVSPSRRYATAALFAQDLRNYLQGQAVSARIPNVLERCWRVVRRYPVMASSLLLVFLAVLSIVGLVVSHDYQVATLNAELNERNELLEGALKESSAARYRNEQIIYSQDIAQASADLQRGDLRSVRSIMDRYAESQSLQGHRDADWGLVKRRAEKSYVSRTKWKAPHALYAGCFKSNGQTLFAGGKGDQITILDPETGNVFFQYSTGQTEINCLRMNSDESLLWSTGDDGSVCAWDLPSDQLKWRTQAFEAANEAHDLVYLQLLDRLVIRGSGAVLCLLSAQDGQLLTDVGRLDFATTAIAGLPDGRHFLVADHRERLFRVDGTDMNPVAELPLATLLHPRDAKTSTRGIEVSPDGRWAVVFSHRNLVYLVDLYQWSIADSIEISESPRVVCFSDSAELTGLGVGQQFWLVTRPGTCIKFEVSPEGKIRERDRWTSESERIFLLVPRPRTQELYSFGGDGSLQQWSKSSFDWQFDSLKIDQHWYCHLMLDCSRWLAPPLNQRNEYLFLQACRRSIDFFSANRNRLQLYEKTGKASLCDVGPHGLWRIEQPSLARSVSWSQLMEQFQAASPKDKPSPIQLSWQERILPYRADELQDLSNNFRLVATDDGQWVAGWDQQQGCVWCMSPDNPEQVRKIAAEEVTLIWFEPSSHHCWFVSRHRELYFWNLNDGSLPQVVITMPNLPAKALALSPDRSRLAIMSDEKSCYLWDFKQNSIVSELMHEENLKDLTFTASGRTLITLGQHGRITCWNIASGRKTFEEAYSTGNIRGGFSRDGRHLIRSSLDNNRWHIEPLGDFALPLLLN